MFRITMSHAALLALLIVSSTALAHPDHSPRKQTAASANNEQSQTAAEDHAERDVLAVNGWPFLLAQVDQQKARPGGDKAPDMVSNGSGFALIASWKVRTWNSGAKTWASSIETSSNSSSAVRSKCENPRRD